MTHAILIHGFGVSHRMKMKSATRQTNPALWPLRVAIHIGILRCIVPAASQQEHHMHQNGAAMITRRRYALERPAQNTGHRRQRRTAPRAVRACQVDMPRIHADCAKAGGRAHARGLFDLDLSNRCTRQQRGAQHAPRPKPRFSIELFNCSKGAASRAYPRRSRAMASRTVFVSVIFHGDAARHAGCRRRLPIKLAIRKTIGRLVPIRMNHRRGLVSARPAFSRHTSLTLTRPAPTLVPPNLPLLNQAERQLAEVGVKSY